MERVKSGYHAIMTQLREIPRRISRMYDNPHLDPHGS